MRLLPLTRNQVAMITDSDYEEAVAARIAAEQKYYGEFAPQRKNIV